MTGLTADWRLLAVIGVALAGLVAALVLTRRVVAGGERTDLGRRSAVTPGRATIEGDRVGFAYRTSSRFADFVRFAVSGDTVTITGPRIPLGLYYVFIGGQLLAFALIPAALLAAGLYGRGRFALVALGLGVAHWAFACVGAAILPQFGNMEAIQEPGGYSRVEFPLSSVRDVRIGKGWDRNGLGLVILPYVPAINAMAANLGVSFEAPDPETGRYVVYTFHGYDKAEAAEVAAALRPE